VIIEATEEHEFSEKEVRKAKVFPKELRTLNDEQYC